MIWLENAYPVLRDSWQTLIIESDDCDGEFCEYTPDYATQLIAFDRKMVQVKDMKRFRSVVFFTGITGTCPAVPSIIPIPR